jgi:pimeloyl-ACP methyl ester carboxylesterase
MTALRTVTFASSDRTLNGSLFDALESSDSRAVMFVHGLGSSQAGYIGRAESLRSLRGIPSLTFDLSGHGPAVAGSEDYSIYDHVEDVVAAYDYLTTTCAGDPSTIGVCGASYGAYLAALLTTRRPVERLLLRAPAIAEDVVFPARDTRTYALTPADNAFDSLVALSRFQGPVLIVESEFDERISHSQIIRHLEACPQAEHEVISGAKHKLDQPEWNAAFSQLIIRFFGDL